MAQSDKEALNLYQLIGAPLLAVVQAEAQAVQVSADFIKQVGFQPGQSTPAISSTQRAAEGAAEGVAQPAPGGAPDRPMQEGGNIGDLRMAHFKHAVRGKDGAVQQQTVNIPVLSLFPIPLLQVKSAEFEFAIRILDHETRGPQLPNRPSSNVESSAPAGLREFLSQNRIELKGKIAREGGANSGHRTSEMSLRVKVRMEQADIPAGLGKLLQIMDQTIHSVAEADQNPTPAKNDK